MSTAELPLAQRTPGRVRRNLDTLRVKLFLAIAGADLVLVMAAYLIYSWSFDRGLAEYLNQSEQERLTPLVTRLAEGYRQHGDWVWVSEDRDRWYALVRETVGIGRVPRRGTERREGAEGAPASAPATTSVPRSPSTSVPRSSSTSVPLDALPPLTIDPRIMLFDAEQRVLIGYRMREQQAVMRPIVVGDATVGFLGYIPRLGVVTSLESIASLQQNRRFGAIAIGLFVAVLLNAALISHWLSRRLRALGRGAAALAQGEYATRIPVKGHDELEQLAGDFNHLALTLEAAQRARQQWIADIAHELRTPLTTLRAEIEAMQDGVRPLSQSSVGSVAQEVSHLTRLVEDLRMLSLSDLGALSYHKEPIRLAELVEECIEGSRGVIKEKLLHVKLDLQRDVEVLGDPDRLAQVFANLLQNTLRYSEPPARLKVALRPESGMACVRWDDSPPGVAPEELPRLTERLYRVDASRARANGGSGLGLAIVKAIVEAHGGRMEASESPLGGLRWTLWLPLLQERS